MSIVTWVRSSKRRVVRGLLAAYTGALDQRVTSRLRRLLGDRQYARVRRVYERTVRRAAATRDPRRATRRTRSRIDGSPYLVFDVACAPDDETAAVARSILEQAMIWGDVTPLVVARERQRPAVAAVGLPCWTLPEPEAWNDRSAGQDWQRLRGDVVHAAREGLVAVAVLELRRPIPRDSHQLPHVLGIPAT